MSKSDIPVYGYDKELAEKAALKYDPQREKGLYLIAASLANRTVPGFTAKPVASKMPFKMMENI
eukprot:jgi/Hompol1/4187/HPOL_006968-RA